MNTQPPWKFYDNNAWSIPIQIHQEEDGGFWCDSQVLPGMATEGETIEECTQNAKEALTGLIESYLDGGKPIPWQPRGCKMGRQDDR